MDHVLVQNVIADLNVFTKILSHFDLIRRLVFFCLF